MPESPHAPSRDDLPHYDAERHELLYRGQLVKRFDQPAKNQEAILAAFEEEGWPSRIDDPISPRRGMDSVERLHDAIKNLNRSQGTPLLRFHGDGSGAGIVWEATAEGRVLPQSFPGGRKKRG